MNQNELVFANKFKLLDSIQSDTLISVGQYCKDELNQSIKCLLQPIKIETIEEKKQNNAEQKISIQTLKVNDYDDQQNDFLEFDAFKQIKQYIVQYYDQSALNVQGTEELTFLIFEWKEEIFNKINENQFKNKIFEQQKSNIFKQLEIQKIYLCKVLKSDEKGDLFLGIHMINKYATEDVVVKTIYKAIYSEIKYFKQMAEYLKLYEFCFVIESFNTILLVVSVNQCLNILNKLKNFTKDALNCLSFTQIENNLEITYKNDKIWQKQAHIEDTQKKIDLLISQNNNQLICQYEDNQVTGIIIQGNQQQLFQKFFENGLNPIFNIQKNEQISSLIIYIENLLNSQKSNKIVEEIKKDKEEKIEIKKLLKVESDVQKYDLQQKNEMRIEQKIENNELLIVSSDDEKYVLLHQQEEICQKKTNKKSEDKLKEIDFLKLMNEYSFSGYLSQNLDEIKIDKSQKREWTENKFEIVNINSVLSDFFKKQQKQIFEILKLKQYYLCKYIFSDSNQDFFIGYQQISDIKYQDCVIIIKNKPDEKQIQDYLNIRYFQEQVVHFTFSQDSHIFILEKDFFTQYYNLIGQKNIMNQWSIEYFNQINSQKELKQHVCKDTKCDNDCLFAEFNNNQDLIFRKLVENKYYLCQYLNKGGFGLIFDGYKYSQKDYKEEFVFKIQFEEDVYEEVQIMKIFENNKNVIKLYNYVQINYKITVLVLEKCKFSLTNELIEYKQRQQFTQDQLLNMLMQLIDGLVVLRMYNIIHLDIKPANILINQQGHYVYTDFGLSTIADHKNEIQIKGYTQFYASPEQIENFSGKNNKIYFQSDIYSLGKTFLQVIGVYEEINKHDQDLLEMLKELVYSNMVQKNLTQRKNCLELHQIILEKYFELNSFEFQLSLFDILKLNPYDKNKDIPYFQEFKLQYFLNILQIVKKHQTQLKEVVSFYESIIILILDQIILCYQNLGDNQKALQYSLESLQMTNIIFKGNHSQIAQLLNTVGICYENLGHNQKALDYFLQSLQMRKQIFQGNHRDIATSLNNIGSCYSNFGDNEKALDFQLQSLEMRTQIFNKSHPEIAQSLSNLGRCYQNLGDNLKAFSYTFQSLEMRKKIYKENHPDIASSLSNLSICYRNLGNNKKALLYSLQSLQMFKQILNVNHPRIAQSLNNVSCCYLSLGDNKNALEYSLKSLQMFKENFQDHPIIAQSLNNVSCCYQNLTKYDQALDFQLQSLVMFKKIFQGNHPNIATSLNNIGSCYQNLTKYDQALDFQLKSLEMRKQIFQGNHPLTASSLSSVGLSYQYLDKNDQALDFQLQSLEMRKQIFQGNHPEIAYSLSRVGSCYQNLGNYTNALHFSLQSLLMFKQIFKENNLTIAQQLHNVSCCYLNIDINKKALKYSLESLQMFKQIQQKNHPQIASSLNNVGICYQHIGNHKKALHFLFQSLFLRKQIFEENHPDIAQSLNIIGSYYQDDGNYCKALELQLESLKILRKIFYGNHSLLAKSLNNISTCFMFLGNYQKALKYSLESLQMRKQIFQDNHPDIADSLNNIGLCYFDLNDYRKALEYYLESLKMREKLYQGCHSQIADSLNNIGSCYQILGDDKKALEYQLKSLFILKQIFQHNHPNIADSLNNIGCCYQNIGDYQKAFKCQFESLKMRKQLFKENHPSIAQSINNIGTCYSNLQDQKIALEYHMESLKMFRLIYSENHPDIASVLQNISFCYSHLGDNKLAIKYQLNSLKIKQKFIKQNSSDIRKSINYLGYYYEQLGGKDMALQYLFEHCQDKKEQEIKTNS